jgi:2'-5' RNA ligase
VASDFTTFLKIVNREKALAKQSFALTLYIPQEINQTLEELRQRYDPAASANIPIHITVKRFTPFFHKSEIEELRQKLAEMSQQVKPFQITAEGYGAFHSPNHNVVFLEIKNPAPLRHLHFKILEILQDFYPDAGADKFEGENYTPHITIGNALSDLDLAVLKHELSQQPELLHFSWEVNQMSLVIAFFQEGHWEIVQTFKFE